MQFKNVVGQRELKKHFIQEVKEDRISHAQLFLGQLGYGGLPLVLSFIQYLFCNNIKLKDEGVGNGNNI
jgi:DNA polymerase-3 subunit delta'